MPKTPFMAALVTVGLATPAFAQSWRQTQADSYTRYELLAPNSARFRIVYDVSATTAGARYYFNGIREGAEEEVHAVYDMATGDELPWEVVNGPRASEVGMQGAGGEGRHYIMVTLARPVPDGGEVRLRIDKTYRDPASYRVEGGDIVFERSLGIRRNAVVLPRGYELIASNYPSQVVEEDDGRIKVSFMNPGPAAVNHIIRARALPEAGRPVRRTMPPAREPATTQQTVPAGARTNYTFTERAHQDREIVYFLQPPETHSFRLYHDYTESRPGVDRYVNVVRAGSRASNPSARLLDTGEALRVETLRGEDITRRGVTTGGEVTPETEVVVIWFDAVQPGHSARLRIEETYTDAGRYLRVGDELIWDRSFGRPRNTVVLPEGWYLTANAVPAVIDETDDGRIRLYYENDRPGNIDAFVKGKHR